MTDSVPIRRVEPGESGLDDADCSWRAEHKRQWERLHPKPKRKMGRKKKYSDEYKAKIVREITEKLRAGDKAVVATIVKRDGLANAMLYRWLHAEGIRPFKVRKRGKYGKIGRA